MRLTELNPSWGIDADIVIGGVSKHFDNRHGMAICFDCPHCVQRERETGDKRVIRLGVWFLNPIDELPPTDDATTLWERWGETFEVLTLLPSVDASKFGHWHGHIQQGEIVGGI